MSNDMSNELVSISDFLDWVEEHASAYAAWAIERMDDAGDYMGTGNYNTLVDSCMDAIMWLRRRNIFMQVEKSVGQLPRVDDGLIGRTVLLDLLSAFVTTKRDRARWSIRRAGELGRRGRYADMVKACKDAMRHEDVRSAYHHMHSYVLCMPTAGTLEGRLQERG